MIRKIVEFLTCFAIYWMIALNLHEWGHFSINKLQGGDGYVKYPHFIDGQHWIITQGYPIWLERASGGLVVALVLGILWYWARRTPTSWDLDDEACFGIIGLIQLAYGLTEGFLYSDNAVLWGIEAGVATVIGGGVGLWYYVPKLARWWASDNDNRC